MTTCDRCHRPTTSVIMSMFIQDELCPSCKEQEEQHPDYQRAREAEEAACRAGNYNFAGIGWPPPPVKP